MNQPVHLHHKNIWGAILIALLLTGSGYLTSAFAQNQSRTVEDGGSGPFKALMISDKTLLTHTVFRPEKLVDFGNDNKLPVITWGNGACNNSPWEHVNFLSEVASHGFLVLAIGPMPEKGEQKRELSKSSLLLDALDWAIKQNSENDSPYYNKIDTENIAVSGMSCGGLQALEVAADERITTVGVFNSGILPNPNSGPQGMPSISKEQLGKLHSPTLYMLGGKSDIAYNNGMDDFQRINHVPVFMANMDVGHSGTYAEPHGGAFAKVATAWYQWQLKGDQKAGEMFTGSPAGLSESPHWTVQKKNIE